MTDYPDGMTLRPLVAWPHAVTTYRERSPFSASWSATIQLLDREIYHLGNVRQFRGNPPSVLQIALREQDFRIDGMPRANAVPDHPGVILNVESSKGSLSFPCDKFDRWQHNLRAIALGLEALRKVDRYGITPGDEQYVGWKALPGPGEVFTAFTADEAEEFLHALVDVAGDGLDLGTLEQVHRRARFLTHPDRGGERAQWDRVESAASVLRRAGRLP